MPEFFPNSASRALPTRDEAHDETGEIFKAVCGLPGATPGFTDEDLT